MEEESFIDRLERLLEEKNFQKKDLAEAVGISRTGISTWRVSGALPRADIAIKIARFLNVSVRRISHSRRHKRTRQKERQHCV